MRSRPKTHHMTYWVTSKDGYCGSAIEPQKMLPPPARAVQPRLSGFSIFCRDVFHLIQFEQWKASKWPLQRSGCSIWVRENAMNFVNAWISQVEISIWDELIEEANKGAQTGYWNVRKPFSQYLLALDLAQLRKVDALGRCFRKLMWTGGVVCTDTAFYISKSL